MSEQDAAGEAPAVVYINLHLEMPSFHGAQVDEYLTVDRKEWEAMNDTERDEYMAQEVDTFLSNHVSAGWGEVDISDVPERER